MSSDSAIASNIAQARIAILKIRQFEFLYFEGPDVPGARCLDNRNVKRLLHRFENEGCRRLDPATWIPCELSRQQLGRLISSEGAAASLSENPPPEVLLPEDIRPLCFQGQHRVAAASQFLDREDSWWVLDIYDSAILTADGRRRLREGEFVPQEFCDGEIYRNARLCQKNNDDQGAKKWLAKWSSTKCDDFNQLHHPEKKNYHQSFQSRMEELLEFPGVWKSWQMGCHLLSWQCPDELTDYVSHISQALRELTNHTPRILDSGTMTLLEGRYPAISVTDRLYIESIFHQLFPLVQDPGLRGDLRRRILAYPHMIPSLKLFLEDTKYLKPIMQLLRAAFCPPRFRGSIRDSLRRRYVEPANRTFPIQVSANGFHERIDERPGYGFFTAYRQLCLFLMRNFFGMSNCLPRGVQKYRGPYKQPDTHELWKQFTRLSEKLGFGTPHCPFRKNTDSRAHEYLAIYSLLRSLRPPDSFEYEDTVLVNISTQTFDALNAMREKPTVASTPSLVMESRNDSHVATRCGMTDIESFFADQKHLYLPNMYRSDYATGPYLTSFAIKRNMFLSFFGTEFHPDDQDANMNETAVPLPGRQADMETSGLGAVPENETSQTSIPEPSIEAPVSQPVMEPVNPPENVSSELVLASQAGNGGMEVDILVEIQSQDPNYCVCEISVEPAEFVAYFMKSNKRQQGFYYLYNVLGKRLVCIEGMGELARFRGNTEVVASLDRNRVLVPEPTLHSLDQWKRNVLYLLFPNPMASGFRTGMFTQSAISDSKFNRMGLPTKLDAEQWAVDLDEGDID